MLENYKIKWKCYLLELVENNKSNEIYRVYNAIKNDITNKFFYMPASLKHHHNQEFGLVSHSLEVYHLCINFTNRIDDREKHMHNISYLSFAALIHDLYKQDEYLKIDNRWTFNPESTNGHHLRKLHQICLDAQAPNLARLIGSHHGSIAFGCIDVPKNPYDQILHWADMQSCMLYDINNNTKSVRFPLSVHE